MNPITTLPDIAGGADPAAAASLRLARTGTTGASDMAQGLAARGRKLLAQPAVARSLPMLGIAGVLALAATAWLVLQEPAQRALFAGLPEADKAAVAAALQSANIGFAIDPATGSLTVSAEEYHAARMTLAGQGLPRGAPDGAGLLATLPMGASRALETEKLRAAREADLARSIEGLSAVVAARVHLAVDTPSVFIRDRSQPAASVVLTLAPGAALGAGQVQAITHLVASSVPGLAAERVSVVDQTGQLLSQEAGQGPLGAAGQQLLVRERIEERYRQALNTLLTPILGPGNFVVQVAAEVDFSEREATSETFPQNGAQLRSEQRSLSVDAGGQAPGGIPGALANQPPPDPVLAEQMAAADAEGTAQSREEQVNRSFEVGRQVAVVREATGDVSRLSIALAIAPGAEGAARTAGELAQIERLVKGAVGFDAGRGDQVAVTSRSFEPVAALAPAWHEAEWVMPVARNLSALLVALAVILFLGRPLLKRLKRSDADTPADAALPAAVRAGSEADTDSGPVTLDMITASATYQERAVLVQDFVRQNPDHAALVVQDLLQAAKNPKVDAHG